MKNAEDKIHMISQPLTTEEGFINPACMNELAAAIESMPESWERLANEPEWSEEVFTSIGDILGSLAFTAVKHHNGCPPQLEKIINYVKACLIREGFPQVEPGYHFENISLCGINKKLWDILAEVDEFQDWNKEEVMGKNWLDLSALLHQVCILIRTERRESKLFDEKYKSDKNDSN